MFVACTYDMPTFLRCPQNCKIERFCTTRCKNNILCFGCIQKISYFFTYRFDHHCGLYACVVSASARVCRIFCKSQFYGFQNLFWFCSCCSTVIKIYHNLSPFTFFITFQYSEIGKKM